MATVHFDDREYEFDIEALDVAQARAIKRQIGLSIRQLMDGLVDIDPEALAALYWLMLRQNGINTDIGKVNFKVFEFAQALNDAFPIDEETEEENPTGVEPRPTQ